MKEYCWCWSLGLLACGGRGLVRHPPVRRVRTGTSAGVRPGLLWGFWPGIRMRQGGTWGMEHSPRGEVGSLYEHVLPAFPGMSDQCGCLALGAV